MFTIRLYKLGCKATFLAIPTTVETLGEAEIIAQGHAQRVFGFSNAEIVYIEELDYFVYVADVRVGRLTITPVYEKRGIVK